MRKQISTNFGEWNLYATDKVSVGDFNNVTDVEKYGIYPGKHGDSAYCITSAEAETTKIISLDDDKFEFSCSVNGCFYGITKDKTEVIGIIKNNQITPVMAGAGGFLIKSKSGTILKQRGIKSYSVGRQDEYETVTVNYETEGLCSFVETAKTTYIFKERCISAVSELRCYSINDKITQAGFERKHLNTPALSKLRVSCDWIYPENNDFAYKSAEAYVVSEKYGETAFYSFVRDKNSEKKFVLKGKNIDLLPVNIDMSKNDIEYTYQVDFVAVDISENESYEALFRSKNMDFAAGIASVEENERNTFFIGKDVRLNLNVKSLADKPVSFCVKYSIMDYYNNEVDAHTYFSNLLNAGEQSNRNLDLHFDKYGMYFLNLYVTTKDYEYRECYPFAMIEDYEFKHRAESPFGICATHAETVDEETSTISILNRIGLSMIRIGSSPNVRNFIDRIKSNGFIRYAYGAGTCDKQTTVENFMKQLENESSIYMNDSTYVLFNNETEAFAKSNYDKSKKYLEENFVPFGYEPVYDFLTKHYPDKLDKIIWQSNCHGTTEWLEAFHESGMWDKSPIIDIHSYSSPSGPDKVFSNQAASMYANTFSNEYAMCRWKRLQRRYGKKRMMVGETGYPSSSYEGCRMEVDLRTQADFNIRITLFFLEAGAEDIIFYCLYDRTSYYIGTGEWNEMYFGACYNYDYYGVYMPKPWAAAYANLTRRFDGFKSCSFNEKYEEGEWGTLRAFDVTTEGNTGFTVLWSNIYKQPNTTAEGRVKRVERIPMPAWENRWIENEIRTFDTDKSEVKTVDVMGNETIYKAENGKVMIPISGSPIFVYGIY